MKLYNVSAGFNKYDQILRLSAYGSWHLEGIRSLFINHYLSYSVEDSCAYIPLTNASEALTIFVGDQLRSFGYQPKNGKVVKPS